MATAPKRPEAGIHSIGRTLSHSFHGSPLSKGPSEPKVNYGLLREPLIEWTSIYPSGYCLKMI